MDNNKVISFRGGRKIFQFIFTSSSTLYELEKKNKNSLNSIFVSKEELNITHYSYISPNEHFLVNNTSRLDEFMKVLFNFSARRYFVFSRLFCIFFISTVCCYCCCCAFPHDMSFWHFLPYNRIEVVGW